MRTFFDRDIKSINLISCLQKKTFPCILRHMYITLRENINFLMSHAIWKKQEKNKQERLTLTKMIAIYTHYSHLHQCHRRNRQSYHIVDAVVYNTFCWNYTGHTWSDLSHNQAALKSNSKINKLKNYIIN